VCVSKPYLESRNCKKELEYADELNKDLILVKLDSELDLKGHGAYSMILSKQLYIQSDDETELFNLINDRIVLKLDQISKNPKSNFKDMKRELDIIAARKKFGTEKKVENKVSDRKPLPDIDQDAEFDLEKETELLQKAAKMSAQHIQEAQESYQRKIMEYYADLNGKM